MPVAPGVPQLVAQPAVVEPAQAPCGHGRTGDVAAQPLESLAIAGRNADVRVHVEPAGRGAARDRCRVGVDRLRIDALEKDGRQRESGTVRVGG